MLDDRMEQLIRTEQLIRSELVPLVFRIEQGGLETLVRAMEEWASDMKLLRRSLVARTEQTSLSVEVRRELNDLAIKVNATRISIFPLAYELSSIIEEVVEAFNSKGKVSWESVLTLLTPDRVDHKFSQCIDDCRTLMDKVVSTAQRTSTNLTELLLLAQSGVTLVRTFAEDLTVKQKVSFQPKSPIVAAALGGICTCIAAVPLLGVFGTTAVIGLGLAGALHLWYQNSNIEAKRALEECNTYYGELSRAISMALMRVSISASDIDHHFKQLAQDPKQIMQLKAKMASLDTVLKLLCQATK